MADTLPGQHPALRGARVEIVALCSSSNTQPDGTETCLSQVRLTEIAGVALADAPVCLHPTAMLRIDATPSLLAAVTGRPS